MNREMKQIALPAPSAGYSHPSVRVVNLGLKHSVLQSASNNESNTDPGEMGEENVF